MAFGKVSLTARKVHEEPLKISRSDRDPYWDFCFLSPTGSDFWSPDRMRKIDIILYILYSRTNEISKHAISYLIMMMHRITLNMNSLKKDSSEGRRREAAKKERKA